MAAPGAPEHDRESGGRRLRHFIEFLREDDWEITFLAKSATGCERYLDELCRAGVAAYAGEDTLWAGDSFLSDCGPLLQQSRFQLALIQFWFTAEHYLPLLRALTPSTRVVVDSVDLHLLRRSRARFSEPVTHATATLGPSDGDEMARELNAYSLADAVLTVSDKEASWVNDLLGGVSRAQSVPDSESLQASPLALEQREGILFLANFRHPPNVQGLLFLIEEVLPHLDPRLLERHPLTIVGNALDASLIARCGKVGPGVKWVGWVPSVFPYLQTSRLSILPLLHGAGTKRKLLQSLMVGTPAVSTRVGTEGLDVEDGRQVLIAEDAHSFATAIARLASDDALWNRLSVQGRASTLAGHEREIGRSRFLTAIERVLRRP